MGKVTKYNAKDCTVLVDDVYITGLGENNLPSALSAEEGKKASETDKPKTTKVAPVKSKPKEGDDKTEETDYQLDRALDIVHAISLSQQQK
jgi:hypothetical protein